MKTVVRYTVRPERVAENETLVKAVFAELDQVRPAGFRYQTLVDDGGSTFVHIVEHGEGSTSDPADELDAFKRFREDLDDRLEVEPTFSHMRVIGAYGIPDAVPNHERTSP